MAPPFQLAGRRQRLKYDLELQVRNYVDDQARYREKLKDWETFGRIKQPPEAPEPPYYLELWFELQRWSGHLLIDGGLYDQPSWIWEMTDRAGQIYTYLMDKRASVEES